MQLASLRRVELDCKRNSDPRRGLTLGRVAEKEDEGAETGPTSGERPPWVTRELQSIAIV